MDNLKIELVWIDGLQQENLMVSLRLAASSDKSSAVQKCDYTTDGLRLLGEAMVEHSFDFDEERIFEIGVGFDSVVPLQIVLRRANFSGLLPIEIVFQLEDDIVGQYPSTVVVWAELGQLERFGRRVAALPKRGAGASCELNPKSI